MEVTKQLLLNLSILLVLLFFLQLRIDRKQNFDSSRKIMFAYFLFAIACCILLSIGTENKTTFDLRQVPLIVGTLYLGPWAGISFYIVAVLFRLLLGLNIGFWIFMIVFGIQEVVLIYVHHRFFQKYSSYGKVATSVLLSISYSILVISVLAYFGIPITSSELLISFIFIPALGTGIMTHTIENWLVTRDIQKQLLKSEKLESISHLSSALAHEIRNPMTAAKGFMQLIVSDVFDEAKNKEYAQIALSEINHAEKIISDFLTYAKPNATKMDIIYLPDEIKKVIEILEPLAHLNVVEIICEFNSSSFINGDKSLIHQCLLNLLKNSIEAMEKGGTLTIYTSQEDNSIQVDIIDTGVGMSENQIKNLGKPFFSTKGEKGTGLGMMTTLNIIDSMNGSMKVSSKEGVGTTFTLSFPLEECA